MARRLVALLGPWLALVLVVGVASAAVTVGKARVSGRAGVTAAPTLKAKPIFRPVPGRVRQCRTVRTKRGHRTTCAPVRCRTVAVRRTVRTTKKVRVRGRLRTVRVTRRVLVRRVPRCTVRVVKPSGGTQALSILAPVLGPLVPVSPAAAVEPEAGLVLEGPGGLPGRIEIYGVAPGTSGSVLLNLTPSRAGAITLALRSAADRPGPLGGRLSDRLRLVLTEVDGRIIWAGLARDLPLTQLGRVAGGETRSVRLTLDFPDGGLPPTPTTGDNVFQGSGMDVDLTFQLVS